MEKLTLICWQLLILTPILIKPKNWRMRWQTNIRQQVLTDLAHILLGYIYTQKRSYSRAYYEDQQALLIDKGMAIAHYNACDTLMSLERQDEAFDECQQAIRVDSHYASAHGILGAIYQLRGD